MAQLKKKGFEVLRAERCAWRGFYLYWQGKQVGRITVDPWDGVKPTLNVSVLRFERRLRLPVLPFMAKGGRMRGRFGLFVYRWQSWFWCGMDGRYGWGTEARRKRAGKGATRVSSLLALLLLAVAMMTGCAARAVEQQSQGAKVEGPKQAQEIKSGRRASILCGALTLSGERCRNRVKREGDHCHLHGGEKAAAAK